MGAIGEFLVSVGRTIAGVLTLNPATAAWFGGYRYSLQVSIAVAVLAGVSVLIGGSVVLFLNRVRGWRFAVTLLLNGIAMVALYAFQALLVAGVGLLVTGDSPGLLVVTRAVMLATAPMVFGFLVLIPYLGPAIGRVLQVWGLLVLWLLVDAVFRADLWQAFWITLIAWGLMQLLSWALSRPVSWAGDRIWRVVTGRPSLMTGSDLLTGNLFLPLDNGYQPSGGR